MLLIQGALLALLGGLSGKGVLIEFVVCVQGLIFTILWYGVVHKGSLYVERWDRVVMQIETKIKEREGEEFFAIRHMNDAAKIHEKRGRIKVWGRTTKIMKVTIATVAVFWIFVGLSILFGAERTERNISFECIVDMPSVRCNT
jgi:hypothetical protein